MSPTLINQLFCGCIIPGWIFAQSLFNRLPAIFYRGKVRRVVTTEIRFKPVFLLPSAHNVWLSRSMTTTTLHHTTKTWIARLQLKPPSFRLKILRRVATILHLLGQKCVARLNFAIEWGWSILKRISSEPFNVTRRQGYQFLVDNASSRRLHNEPENEDPRGRKPLISPKKIRETERILETEGIEARSYTREPLEFEVGLECSRRTVQMAMGTMDYHNALPLGL